MQSIEQLLERFLDDRDALAEDELDALVDAAGRDPQLAARLKDQLVIEELLAQQLAVERRNFPAHVRQLVREEDVPPTTANIATESTPVDETLAGDLEKLAGVEFEARQEFSHRQRLSRGLWLAASALLLAAAAGAWWWQQSRMAIAVVTSAGGAPSIVAQGQPQTAKASAAIHQGDQLVTRPGETLLVKFTDGSTLELLGDTSLTVRGGRGATAKNLALEWGNLAADVRPQPSGALLTIATPLAIATVRGTRLRLSADSSRTRLDVIEGVVQLVRQSDGAKVNVQSREFAVATASELAVNPLAWPVDQRDAIVILETGDPATLSVVRHAASRELRSVKLQPRGRARMNHDFAWVLTGGAFVVPDAGRALRTACRATGELTLEATIKPDHLQQRGPAQIISFARDAHEFNFLLGQEENRLLFRLQTSDPRSQSESIDIARLSAARPQHVAVAYRSGELVCYLNGRRVYHDTQLRGGLEKWLPLDLLLGDVAAEHPWAGTVEGVAIYDRFLSEEEIARNAQQYHEQLAARAKTPQVELSATLIERSPPPTPESIAPQRAALVVSRYRVDEVLRGKLSDDELLIAQWAVLDGVAQSPATIPIGTRRHLTIERLGLNPQLSGVPRVDEFHNGDDPQRARYFEVSEP